MGPDERLGLARTAYVRAIAVARVQSTPRAWKRLLAAAKNVQATMREMHERRPVQARPSSGGAHRAAAAHSGIVDIPRPRELATESARARALAEQSRRLVRDSVALCSSIALLLREARALRSAALALLARLPAPASPWA